MRAAAIYYRLSASRLGEEAPGLERQRRDCERLIRERGWELAEEHVFHDADTSAFRPGVPRPGFEDLRRAVEAEKVEAIVVWKLDRAFRRLPEAVEFLGLCRDRGVAFLSQQEGIDTSSPWGSVLFSLFASLGEIESQTRSDRIKAWQEQRARAGKPVGGGSRPFGFERDGITHVPAETDQIRQAARDLLDDGNLTRVSRAWNDSGILTTTGKEWTKTTVRRMLLSPRIAGLRQLGAETFPAMWEPIITEQDHLRLRARYGSPGKAVGRRYLLTGGIARCGVCTGPLIARPKADGRRCYVCDSRGCGKIRVLAAPVEELGGRGVDNYYAEHPRESPEPKEPALRAQLEADERALEELARDRYVTRSISDAEFRAAREGLVARIEDEQAQLAKARASWSSFYTSLADLPPAPWELPPGTDPDPNEFEGWRRWITDIVDCVTVKPAVRGRTMFDPSRVIIARKARPGDGA
jgi:site-specific DNA recombinase